MATKKIMNVIHIDDESDDTRRLPEIFLEETLDKFFEPELLIGGDYVALKGGFGDVSIDWDYKKKKYILKYFKCPSENDVEKLEINKNADVLFIFDVHRISKLGAGAGNFLESSIKKAKEKMQNQPFEGLIWTQVDIQNIKNPSNFEIFRKGYTREFSVEVFKRLGLKPIE